MIYEYTKNEYMNGVVNRRRIRRFYDPDVEFFSFSYHKIWNEPNRYFITINFTDQKKQSLFEMEFGCADLCEVDQIPKFMKSTS